MINPHPPRSVFSVVYVRVFKRFLYPLRNGRRLYQWRFQIRGASNEVLASATKLNSKQAVSDAIWRINPNLPVVWP